MPSLIPTVSVDSESVNGTNVTLQGHASSNVWVGGTTVEIFDGGKAIGTANADSNGAWTFTTGALSGGSHTLTAEANNFFGYASAPASKTATISGSAPPPTGSTGTGSTGTGSTGTGSTGTGSTGTGSTGTGSTGTGSAGTGSAVPSAPIIASFSPDSGVAGDHITNATTFNLTGSAVANSTVHVFDGNTQIGTATANGSGAWTFATPSLTDGSHNLHATATNSAGSSAASSTYAVTVDTVAPNAPVETADSVINGNAVQVTGTAEAHSTVKVYEGTSLVATATADSTGAWNATTGALSSGAHALAATATDAAGNISGLSPVLDPVISSVTPPSGGQNGSAGAPQLPDLLSGYAVRPAWQVAGVDYAVGVQAGTSLKDPGVAGNLPPGVSLDSVNHVVNILGNNVTLNGLDFSLHGGWTVNIQPGTTGTTTIENCNFSLNANQPIAINASSTDVGNLTVLNCSFNGNQMNIPSVQPPPAGTGLGAAISYDGNGSFVAKYNYIHDMPADGIDLGDGTVTPTIEYNVFKGLGYTPGSHPDPVQFVGDVVNNATIAYNTIYQPQGVEANEGLAVQAQLGSTITNTTIANNVIIATGPNMTMSLNIGLFQDSGNVLKGVTVANNYVDPTGTFTTTGFGDLPSEVQGSNLTISHNINLLTGQTTAPSAGTFSTANVPNLPNDGPPSATSGGTSSGGTTPPPSQTGDTVAPNAPVIVGDTVAADKVQVSGTAEAGSTIKLYDGSSLLGTTQAAANGSWNLTTSSLNQGPHTLKATATDAAGNTSGFSQAVAPVIGSGSSGQQSPPPPSQTGDTVAPNAPVIVGDTVAADKVQVSGTAEAGSTIKLYDGSSLLGTTQAAANGSWNLTTSSLNQGPHTLKATATDAAGNTSVFSQAVAPVIGSGSSGQQSPPPPSQTGDTVAPNAPVIVGDTVAADKVQVSGTAEAGSTIKLYDGSSLLGTTQAAANGSWNLTTSSLNQGPHTLTATATDAAGNISGFSQTVDPVIGSGSSGQHSPPPPTDAVAPAAPVIAAETVVHNTVQVSGTAEAGSTINLYDGSTLLGTTHVAADGDWNLTTPALHQGAHALAATATDAAGNTSGFSQAVDPVIGSGSSGQHSPSPPTDAVAPDAPVITAETVVHNTVQMSGTAEAGSTIKLYDGSTLLGATQTAADGDWNLTTPALHQGSHALAATATDTAGNTSDLSQAVDPVIGVASSPGGSWPGHGHTSVSGATPPFTGVHQNHHQHTATLTGTADSSSSDGTAGIGSVTTSSDGNGTLTNSASSSNPHISTGHQVHSTANAVTNATGAVVVGSAGHDRDC